MKVAILTVSDRCSREEREDLSGPLLSEMVSDQGWSVIKMDILPDDQAGIEEWLIEACDSEQVDLVLTTGGTGFSPRDQAPEATLAVIERAAVAGIRGKTLIVNLPGSPRGASENLEVIIPVLEHATALIGDDLDAEAGHLHKPKPRFA